MGMRAATLRDTVKPLVLAPAGAVSVASVLLFLDNDFGFRFQTAVILAYFLVVCYVAELLFVVPGLALWPGFRKPHPIAAGVYGVLVAWSLPAVRWLVEGNGWQSLAPAAIAGAASG